jgi:ABC-2 type transport system ATP-binding protein
MPGYAFRTERLTKSFGAARALSELDWTHEFGGVVGLLGPNGAGKTTTLKLLLGMLRPTSGRVQVLGVDSTHDALEVKRRVGFTPDEPSFYDFLSGRETVDFVIRMRGLSPDDAWSVLTPLVARLDFGADLERPVGGFSHGTKKKLALLLAFPHRPRLLLLDEPTNGLDPPAAAEVRKILREFTAGGGAVVVSTHLLDAADRLCDRVLLLDRGRALFEGPPSAARLRAGLDAGASLEDAFLALLGRP